MLSPAASRDHSERMLSSAGVRIETQGLSTTLYPPARLESQSLEVPGDFSSAAFFIVAGLLAAAPEGLLLENVGLNPTRTGLLDILRSMGGRIEIENARSSGTEPVADLRVHLSALRGIDVPPAAVPLAIDEFPVLFIAAACARGRDPRHAVREELRVKESDRIAAMAAGFDAMGVEHEATARRHAHRGQAPMVAAFGGGEIDSRGDHRIAMAFSIASLRAAQTIAVRNTANVATSFPGFVALARAAGLDLAESSSPAA